MLVIGHVATLHCSAHDVKNDVVFGGEGSASEGVMTLLENMANSCLNKQRKPRQ